MRNFVWIAFGLLLAVTLSLSPGGSPLSAEEKEEKKEVPYPVIPEGGGKIDKNAPKVFTKLESGLKYRILRKGVGLVPNATDTVEVHYHGWFAEGKKVFDSSYERGASASFKLNGVIKGWSEGLQLVGAGGMIELEIPSHLAYGKRGAPPTIPPDATLHFLVELISVE